MTTAALPARIDVREVLDRAWSLFQVCLPRCLPLVVVAVVAGQVPGAAVSGQRLTAAYSVQWWLLSLVSAAVVLVCYGAMLRQQLAVAAGGRLRLMTGLGAAAVNVPGAFMLVLASTLPFVPAMAWTAWRGFDVAGAVLTAVGAGLAVYGMLAWPAMVVLGSGPWRALACSIGRVQGRWFPCLGVFAGLLALTLVFILLASILLGMVMNLAGQGISPTPAAQAFSKVMLVIVVAMPAVYAGAVVVTLWNDLSGAPASPGGSARGPAA